jgi:membrane fusion protein, multidrug efflux system
MNASTHSIDDKAMTDSTKRAAGRESIAIARAPQPQQEARREPANEAASSVSAEQPESLRQRLRKPLMIAGPVIVALVAGYFYITGGRFQSTNDAYVRAAQVSISSNVSGRVVDLAIRDNQQVAKGELLYRLDERPFKIAVDEAQAQLATTRLQVESLKATYRQRQADLRSAQTTLDYQQREYERQQRLLIPGIASQSQVDKALLSRDAAQQTVSAAKETIASVLASLGGNPEIPVDQHPSVQQAQAQLDRAKLNLSYTRVVAPIDGIVTKVEQLQVGDYINASTPVFALVSTKNVWVEANFKEVQLGHMRAGQTAEVDIDAYPDKTFHARVVSVSPGTGTEFSMLPAENATGNWVKVVQRLPVRLEIDSQDFASLKPGALRSGLSANVEVDTRHRRGLFGLRSEEMDEVLTADAQPK